MGLEFVVLLVLILCIVIWQNLTVVNWIPSSVLAVLLGMLVSVFDTRETPFVFAPELFLYLLLPPILLQSSFNFKVDSLRRTWVSSLMFALVGTMLTIVMIAWGITVWVPTMDVVNALLMASLLAPTDTVATLMLTKSLDDPFIAEVLENEAVLNDAISIVLVRLFATMSEEHQVLNRWIPMRAMGISIFFMFLAGLFGFVSAKAMRKLDVKDVSIHVVVALIVYALCEYVGISGIVGLFSYGAMVKPPKEVKTTILNISVIVEAYVYLTIGLALRSYDMENIVLSFLILFSCVVGRVVVVFVLGGLLRLCGQKYWKTSNLLFFSMCGIRGAISFAMCMGLRSEWSGFIQSTSFVVIVSTIFSMGTLQKCMQEVLLDSRLTLGG